MALKQCPECKREISEKAKRCPHCGFKDPRTGDKVFWTFLILFFVAVAAVVIMVVVHTQKVNRAKANLDESIRRADAGMIAYTLIYSTPSPTPTLKATPSPASQRNWRKYQHPQFVTLRQDVLVQLPSGTSPSRLARGWSLFPAIRPKFMFVT